MTRYDHFFWILSLLIFPPNYLNAQEDRPYFTSLRQEIIYGGVGLASNWLGLELREEVPRRLVGELRFRGVSDFDDAPTEFSSHLADQSSDYFMLASAALPAIMLTDRRIRGDFGQVLILYTEAMLLNQGLTNIIKASVRRVRPYALKEPVQSDLLLTVNDQASFLSGHTSAAATGSFFFARVFTDYYPDSPLRPYVWGAALVLPAITGYLRVRGGKHYPSDVLAGYLMGGAIGYLIPVLHRNNRPDQRLQLLSTDRGLSLTYQLN